MLSWYSGSMAFEQTPPPPPPFPTSTPPVVKRRRFDAPAFYGTIIGIVILALVLFIFRKNIADKIAEWRGTGSPVAIIVTGKPSISPAPTTPTPTATATSTPSPTAAAKSTATPKATKQSVPGENIPQTGPGDTLLLVGLVGGSATAGMGALRYQLYRRNLKKQLGKIDIL